MQSLRTLSTLLLMVSLVGGCSKGRPNFNETEILSQMGFNSPITFSASLMLNWDWNGNLYSNEQPVMAFLREAGFIRVSPKPSAQPYWIFNIDDAEFKDQTVIATIASRKITARSEEKSWAEGNIEYFAETISYRFEIPAHLKSLLNSPDVMAERKFRLVIKNDPAFGKWTLADRGNDFDSNDAASIIAQIPQLGQPYISDLTQAIQSNRNASFAQIANDLKSSGTIEKALDPYVLTSKIQGLAFYVKPNGFSLLSVNGAKRYCSTIASHPPRQWRLAATGDFQKVVQPFPNQSGFYNFVDTPDGRIWGSIAVPSHPNGFSNLFQSDYFIMNPQVASTELPVIRMDAQGTSWGGNMVSDVHGVLSIVSRMPKPFPGDANDAQLASDQGQLRVICVANL